MPVEDCESDEDDILPASIIVDIISLKDAEISVFVDPVLLERVLEAVAPEVDEIFVELLIIMC